MSFLDKLDEEQLQNANLIVDEAKKAGVSPRLALALAYHESGLRHTKGNDLVTSSKGASGIMQLMPGTAKDLNVDPTDKFQNIKGGVTYLKMMMDRPEIKGDPMLAAIAYNAGPDNQFFKGGELPSETKGYLNSIKGLGGFDQTDASSAPANSVLASNTKESTQKSANKDQKETGYDIQEFIIPAGAAASGASVGTGLGAYAGKGIAAEQQQTRSVLTQIDSLVSQGKVDQAKNIAQLHFGDKPITFSDPGPALSPGEKWAAGSIERPASTTAYSVGEQARSYRGAQSQSGDLKKFHRNVISAAAPGEPPAAFERAIFRQKQAEAAAIKAAETQSENLDEIRRLASKAQVKSGLEAAPGVLGKASQFTKQFPIPSGAVMGGLGGAGAAFSGIEAAESYRQNDIPMFVMNALQSIGSGLSVIPATAIPAAAVTTGIAALSEIEKGRRAEAFKDIEAKKRFEARPAPTPEEIAAIEEMGPATSRQGLGFRP